MTARVPSGVRSRGAARGAEHGGEREVAALAVGELDASPATLSAPSGTILRIAIQFERITRPRKSLTALPLLSS